MFVVLSECLGELLMDTGYRLTETLMVAFAKQLCGGAFWALEG